MGHTRRRSAKRAGRNFSTELEQFLAGDDTAFTDNALASALVSEKYFYTEDLQTLMSPAEIERYVALQEDHARRQAAGETIHYRKLAAECGFIERWQAFVDRGVTPAYAFEYSRSEHLGGGSRPN